jgi:hypothetical protein
VRRFCAVALAFIAVVFAGCGSAPSLDVEADEHFEQVLKELRAGEISVRVEQRHFPADSSAGEPPQLCELDVVEIRRDTAAFDPHAIVFEVEDRRQQDCR